MPTLAQIATVLGEINANILGFLPTTSGAKGHVKLIVDDVAKAKGALKDAHLSYTEQVVLHAKLATRLEPLNGLLRHSPREGSTSIQAIKRSRRTRRKQV